MFGVLLVILHMSAIVLGMDPKFDPTTRMRLVLVPADAAIGSVIYRLRATDDEFDYPLQFELMGDASSSTVQVDTLPCTKYNSVCQANVVLTKRLEPGRYYDFQVSVKDTKGGTASQSCSITATNFTTPHDTIFSHKPAIIMIPEDAKRGTELDYVIARKNPLLPKPVYLELWGSPLFAIRQKIVSPNATEGTIFLLGPLDFETQSMYHLSVLANDAYAEPDQDSRNIAGLEVIIVVGDVQDVPPVFTVAPPITRLPASLLPGDKIMQVHAEDGDKGSPREIRYGLVSEGNPFTSFFDINETSGEVFLVQPVDDISAITHIGDPVVLTIIAEEVKVARDEPPAMATTVQLALLLPERSNSPPYFENDHYVSRMDENSPQGSALVFVDPYVPRVYDDDAGKNGVFSLTLLNNNGTFEISPNVAERRANFLIRVRDNQLLDYEMHSSVYFQIVAQEIGPATNLSTIVNVTVFINDVNDNPPMFEQTMYLAEMPENMTAGTRVMQVQAKDVDTGLGGRVRYTQILGYLNTSLNLDAETGWVTVTTNNHGFDREMMPEYHFYVEARDDEGTGNRAQVPLVIKVLDVNDETPMFEKVLYEFIMSPDLRNFTAPAFIKAFDNDAEPPNNVVRYELIYGNYENKFNLNSETGELMLHSPLVFRSPSQGGKTAGNGRRRRRRRQATDGKDQNVDVYVLTARAFDLGVPVRWSTTTIRIYPPESRARTVAFVVPGSNPDRTRTEEELSAITGGRAVIHSVRAYTSADAANAGGSASNGDKSIVEATIFYDSNSVVDVTKIHQRFSSNVNSSRTIVGYDESAAATIYKSENRLLFWLLILLALLIALAILTLLFCCICSWCPLYAGSRKRVIRVNSTEDDVHLVHREMGVGKQSKSVQVAEWMGRREAWSADRSSDSRTKPTRWEFSRRQQHNHQKLGHDNPTLQIDDEERNAIQKDARDRTLDEKQSIKLRSNLKETTKLQNSQTNVTTTDRDVFVVADTVKDNNEIEIDKHQEHQHADYATIQRDDSFRQSKRPNFGDEDSLRRHEIDRGSEMDYDRRTRKTQNMVTTRDQLFIKDGNAEILRLVTRGNQNDENIYVNVSQGPSQQPLAMQYQQQQQQQSQQQPHYIMVDNSGKEILLRRFIEEQSNGKQIIREHYQVVPGPNAAQAMPLETYVTKSQPGGGGSITYLDGNAAETQNMTRANSHHSLIQHELETSLKQQNALLRQILLEKEKLQSKYNTQEVMLETQSLPGHTMMAAMATQTDCETGTQTDALPLRPATDRRRTRSENDESESEDEYEYVRYSPPNSPRGVYVVKRRHPHRRKVRGEEASRRRAVTVEQVKRKIRTPIKEEELEESKSPLKRHTSETRTSMLRRLRNEKYSRSNRINKGEMLKKDTLMEISRSLDEKRGEGKSTSTSQVRRIKRTKTYRLAGDATDERNGDHEPDIDEDNDVEYPAARGYYSADSLEDISPDEKPVRAMRRDHRHKGSTKDDDRDARDNHDAIHSIAYEIPRTPIAQPRLSRKDSLHNANDREKTRRQTTSEPPNRPLKARAPKPPADASSKFQQRAAQKARDKAQSETDMLKRLEEESVPRYMEWYFNKAEDRQTDQLRAPAAATSKNAAPKKRAPRPDERTADEFSGKYKPEPMPRAGGAPPADNRRLLKEDIQMARNLVARGAGRDTDTNHSLLQHSEHRFEHDYEPKAAAPATNVSHYMYPETPPQMANAAKKVAPAKIVRPPKAVAPTKEAAAGKRGVTRVTIGAAGGGGGGGDNKQQLNVATLEDDHDSGIAMNSLLNSMGRRNPIADKKSVFTIAYDDVRVKRIASEGDSPPFS